MCYIHTTSFRSHSRVAMLLQLSFWMQLIVETTRATIRESRGSSARKVAFRPRGGSWVLLNVHPITQTTFRHVRATHPRIFHRLTCANQFVHPVTLPLFFKSMLRVVWTKGANTSDRVASRVRVPRLSLRFNYVAACNTHVQSRATCASLS